jgi:hypothetical protein
MEYEVTAVNMRSQHVFLRDVFKMKRSQNTRKFLSFLIVSEELFIFLLCSKIFMLGVRISHEHTSRIFNVQCGGHW